MPARVPLLAQSPTNCSPQQPGSEACLHIKPRYYRWHVDPGVEWVETNTDHATLDWTIPLSQTALVLVDVWDHHYLLDTEARAEAIIADKLVPLMTCLPRGRVPDHSCSLTGASHGASQLGEVGQRVRAGSQTRRLAAGRISREKRALSILPTTDRTAATGTEQAQRRAAAPSQSPAACRRTGHRDRRRVASLLPATRDPLFSSSPASTRTPASSSETTAHSP